jgi:hypothetical protein
MSDFECGDDVVRLRLTSPKLTQLLNCARAKIELLERRNEWASTVIKLFPELPDILQPEIASWHCFRKHRRNYIIKYVAEKNLWRLNVAERAAPPQDPRSDAGGGAKPPPPMRTSAIARRARKKGQPRAALTRTWWEADAPRARSALSAAYGRLQSVWNAVAAAICTALTALQPFVRAHAPMAPVLTAFFKGFADDAEQESFADARLERRLLRIGPNLTLVLNTLVQERPQWEAWLFGKPTEEEQLLA